MDRRVTKLHVETLEDRVAPAALSLSTDTIVGASPADSVPLENLPEQAQARIINIIKNIRA